MKVVNPVNEGKLGFSILGGVGGAGIALHGSTCSFKTAYINYVNSYRFL